MADAEIQIPVILAHLESMAASIARLEATLAKDIGALKTEQIAELKVQIWRLADDQRRLWEALRVLEGNQNQAAGGMRVLHGTIALIGGVIGGVVTAISNKILH